MKNALIFGGLSLLILIGSVWWSNSLKEQQLEAEGTGLETDEIISRTGIHAHPKLTILVNGEQQPIPGNIGVGPQHVGLPTYNSEMKMAAMHTHEADGAIHLEFAKLVTIDDTRLKNFFAIWGKDFMSFGSSVTMTVNGAPNTELENYAMKDGDKIELRYE